MIQNLALFSFLLLDQSLWKSSAYIEFWKVHLYLNYCCFEVSHSHYFLIMRALLASRETISRPSHHSMVRGTVWGWNFLVPSPWVYDVGKNCHTSLHFYHNLNRSLTASNSTRACSQMSEAECFMATSLNLSFMEGKLKLCFHQVQLRFLEICPCKQNCRFFPPALLSVPIKP